MGAEAISGRADDGTEERRHGRAGNEQVLDRQPKADERLHGREGGGLQRH